MKNSSAFESPLGWLKLEATDTALALVQFVDKEPVTTSENRILTETKRQLADYFAGTLKVFSLPFQLEGSEFQKKVWMRLADIPYGELKSYRELAESIGHERAFRAVGSALGKNRLPIILPCHRIIQAGRKIGGFTGGLHLKRFLLRHEGLTNDPLTGDVT